MRKTLSAISAVMFAVSAISCSDNALTDRLDSAEDRLAQIESQIASSKSGLEALEALVAAAQEGIWIKPISTKYDENGKEAGYVITLESGEELIILNGKKGEVGDQGPQGDKGEDGIDGKPGIFPDFPNPDEINHAEIEILEEDPFERVYLTKDGTLMVFEFKDGRKVEIPVRFDFAILCSCEAVEGCKDQARLEYSVMGAGDDDKVYINVACADKNLLVEDFDHFATSGTITVTARQDITDAIITVQAISNNTGSVTAKTHKVSLEADPNKWDDIMTVDKINLKGELIDGRGSRNGQPWRIVSGDEFSYGHQQNVVDAGRNDWRYGLTLARAIDGDISTDWVSRWEPGYDLEFPLDIIIDLGASIAPCTVYITDHTTHKLAWRDYEAYLSMEYGDGKEEWIKVASGKDLRYMTIPEIDGYNRTYELVCDKVEFGRYLKLRVTGYDSSRCGENGKGGKIAEIRLRGIYEHPSPYPGMPSYVWEKNSGKLPQISDMDLCYGGSQHRSPYRWDKARFAPHVSYIDDKGKEQWLHESFLAIEFVDTKNNMTYQAESNHLAADKNSWTQLLDYWFEDGYGFDALEQAVEDVRWRIGNPKSKRMVIMTIPDPIMHRKLGDNSSESVYWGNLDGKALDFSKPEDRRAALRWYIDETNRRFDAKNYKNIELIGFYIISEDMSTTDNGSDGWSASYKRYDQLYPATADYIHSKGEGLYWIPYYRAGGFSHWKEYGIDLAIMQPNYFWNADGRFPNFFNLISTYDMGMELEFDELLLGPGAEAEVYRQNFRAYMDNARAQRVYGSKAFATYAGGNAIYELYRSSWDVDRQTYDDYCTFIIDNPRKKY